MNRLLAHALIFALILLCCHDDALSQKKPKWRTRTRLQVSYEFDDNIRENPADSSETTGDSSLRLLFHSRATRRSARSALAFEVQGGLQTYLNNAIENKLINEIKASAATRVGAVQIGVRSSGRLKIYLSDVLDYATGAAELFLRPPGVLGFGNELRLGAEGLVYNSFPIYDSSVVRFGWTVSRKLTSRVSWRASVSRSQIFYDRNAFVFDPEPDRLEVLVRKQRDRNWQVQTHFNYTRKFLLDFTYSFQHNGSNSTGYTFDMHQFVLVFGLPLSDKLWLRVYGAAQLKDYTEDSLPIFPRDIDPERDESNFFILDLSRDLSSNLSALLRFAYYNNESVIRSRFYRKSLFMLGFDFRF
ncbi:MAG: hypothetical protein ACE5IY_19610 [bacterium]